MPKCCALNCCEHYEDGIFSGKETTIDPSYRKQLTVIFEDQMNNNNIIGSKSAVEFGDNNIITFTQLNDISTAMGKDIRDRVGFDSIIKNPDQDPLIAICIPKSEKAICVIFAILKTGAAYLPLDPEYPEQLLLDILSTFRPILLISDINGPIFNKYDSTKFSNICKILTLEELWVDMDIPVTKEQRKSSIDLKLIEFFERKDLSTPIETRTAVVFHTRGLHGNPVGVRLSHLSIINRVLFDWRHVKLKPKDACSLTLSFSIPDSVGQIFSTLLKGCTIHAFRRVDLKDMALFVKKVALKKITRLTVPNHCLRTFLLAIDKSGREDTVKSLENIKHVISRGGNLRFPDVVIFFKIFKGVTLLQCNGPAETTGEVIYEKFTSVQEFQSKRILGRVTLGKAIDNSKTYILGAHLGTISDGNQGELCFAGLCLSLGYVDENNSKGKNNFVPNPHDDRVGYNILFRSGDYGRIIVGTNGKRHLYIEGRADSIVQRQGHFLSVEDIENVLKDLSNIKDAHVYIHHRGKPSQEIIAFIIPNETKLNTGEIDYALRENLPDWAMPDEMMVVQTLPGHFYEDFCGYCLMERFHEKREPKYREWDILGFSPEKMEIAITCIKGIFKFASIAVEVVINSLDKSFFELGGSSANAVVLLIYLNKKGFPVTLKDFYTSKTLRDFINMMESKQTIGAVNVINANATLSLSPSVATVQSESCTNTGILVRPNFPIMLELIDEFSIDILKKKYKSNTIEIIAKAYCEKGELQAYNMISIEDLKSFLLNTWSSYVEDGVSIIVTRKADKSVVAVAICQDFFTIADTTKANGALFHLIEFYHDIKGNLLQFVPHRQGETLEICWMATHQSIKARDNIKLITMLHMEIIKLAKQAGFTGIFNPTSNKLSRALCRDVFGYMLLEDFKVNKFKELDGSRPFHLAGDLVICAGLLLRIREPDPPSEQSSRTMVDPVAFINKVAARKKSHHVEHPTTMT